MRSGLSLNVVQLGDTFRAWLLGAWEAACRGDICGMVLCVGASTCWLWVVSGPLASAVYGSGTGAILMRIMFARPP